MKNAKNSKTPLVVGAVLGVAVIGSLVAWMRGGTSEPAPEQVAPEDTAPEQAKYADGQYSAGGTYTSPAGAERVDVTVTLQGDVVTDATFAGRATNPGSVRMQDQFAEGYRQLVVGKRIDEISLGVVNGSSLTPKGFMDALSKIQQQALVPAQS